VDFDDPTDTPKRRSDRRQQREADVASWFEKPASQIAAAGLDMEIRVEHGIAAEVILRLANEPGYDLLAMTTHGRSGLARWAFGSVADRVLSACQKPILLKRVT
ncbi:MAG: universal stress protein, partial [Pseudomonadota bacterium]